jgi:uncharacterized protein YbjT (DUF2867 family)
MNSHRMNSNSAHHDRHKHRPSPTVMVTGSSGFIGQRVIRQFSARSTSTIATYYHRLPEALPQVFPVCTDMASPELLLAPLRNVHTVIHLAWEGGLAGSLRANQSSANEDVRDLLTPERMSRNLSMMANLIAAMEKVGNQRIIFVSAMGASRHAETPFLREKYAAEILLLNSRIKEKIILRPSIVSEAENPDDRFLRAVLRTMKLPLLYPVPRWPVPLRPIHVDDMAREIVRAAENSRDESTIIGEICGTESYAVDEIFRMTADKFFAGQKLALKGWIGNTLTPLFEREGKNESQYRFHRLRHFLALAQVPTDTLASAIGSGDSSDKKRASFSESLQIAPPLQKREATPTTAPA